MPDRYPRDTRGHDRNPPDPQWSGDARLALQLVINSEEGGEHYILHGDAASKTFLSKILGAPTWTGHYGARAGFPKLRRLRDVLA